jgi:hypothetical protein
MDVLVRVTDEHRVALPEGRPQTAGRRAITAQKGHPVKQTRTPIAIACASVALLALGGCGSGGGDEPAPPATPTSLTTTVLDGAITNALVCMDLNDNGACDADEPQARSVADGTATLTIPPGTAAHPLLAIVDTDATDADHGAVTGRFVMTTPADSTGVISPLTTLVQAAVADTGASTTDAASAVQSAAGLTTSPLAN